MDEKFPPDKIRVGESNGDIISASGRHLAAKITSGSILKVSKLRVTCKTHLASFVGLKF
jgi:hypothetical protein